MRRILLQDLWEVRDLSDVYVRMYVTCLYLQATWNEFQPSLLQSRGSALAATNARITGKSSFVHASISGVLLG